MGKFPAAIVIGFAVLVMGGAAFGMVNMKYNMCRDAGHSKSACVLFAGAR